MKRAPGESFEEYQKRRKENNIASKISGKIRIFFSGGTYRRKEKEEPAPKRTLISAAVGKRHQGELIEDFKERRKICNHKRRMREKERNW